MKILGREEQWIHTHFLTDGARLSEIHMKEVTPGLTPYLRELEIVYGIHLHNYETNAAAVSYQSVFPF